MPTAAGINFSFKFISYKHRVLVVEVGGLLLILVYYNSTAGDVAIV